MVLEAWLKWLRVGKDLWEVLGSTPNEDKNIPIKIYICMCVCVFSISFIITLKRLFGEILLLLLCEALQIPCIEKKNPFCSPSLNSSNILRCAISSSMSIFPFGFCLKFFSVPCFRCGASPWSKIGFLLCLILCLLLCPRNPGLLY